jgi:tRNA threonylcarbamoyladenosine biosynthesis protein TsaE
MTEFICNSLKDTRGAAEYFARSAEPGMCFALSGDLGSGKTTFSKYFIRFLNGSAEDITSPSFGLVHVCDSAKAKIRHIDCYRLKSEEEFRELGADEALSTGCILLIEWPEIIRHLLPANTVGIRFLFDGKTRKIIAE